MERLGSTRAAFSCFDERHNPFALLFLQKKIRKLSLKRAKNLGARRIFLEGSSLPGPPTHPFAGFLRSLLPPKLHWNWLQYLVFLGPCPASASAAAVCATQTDAQTHRHTDARTHTRTRARAHTHTHTKAHAHTHTHTHTTSDAAAELQHMPAMLQERRDAIDNCITHMLDIVHTLSHVFFHVVGHLVNMLSKRVLRDRERQQKGGWGRREGQRNSDCVRQSPRDRVQ